MVRTWQFYEKKTHQNRYLRTKLVYVDTDHALVGLIVALGSGGRAKKGFKRRENLAPGSASGEVGSVHMTICSILAAAAKKVSCLDSHCLDGIPSLSGKGRSFSDPAEHQLSNVTIHISTTPLIPR